MHELLEVTATLGVGWLAAAAGAALVIGRGIHLADERRRRPVPVAAPRR